MSGLVRTGQLMRIQVGTILVRIGNVRTCQVRASPPQTGKVGTGQVETNQGGTAPEGIKDLYINTYKERLRNRDMNIELMDVYFLKMKLWDIRNEHMRSKKQ